MVEMTINWSFSQAVFSRLNSGHGRKPQGSRLEDPIRSTQCDRAHTGIIEMQLPSAADRKNGFKLRRGASDCPQSLQIQYQAHCR